jgi:hypothetical protein
MDYHDGAKGFNSRITRELIAKSILWLIAKDGDVFWQITMQIDPPWALLPL